MLTFLTYATIAVAVVVVLVLAVTLISVAVALRRASKYAAALAGGLVAINGHVEPLREDVTTINGALTTLLAGLRSADGHLAAVARALGLEK